MMLFRSVLLALGVAAIAAADVTEPRSDTDVRDFPPKVIFTPPSSWDAGGVRWARTVELSDNTLLATWEEYGPDPPLRSFPIWESRDGGSTWAPKSNVTDATGQGLRFNPCLYELPRQFGGFPKGTVLLAGVSAPKDLSISAIQLYASHDRGTTWNLVSPIMNGGSLDTVDSGALLSGVEQPFLMLYQDQMIVYYANRNGSDEQTHVRTIVRQTSTDLKSWTPVVTVVHQVNPTDPLPGLPTVQELPNGQFIMTYELDSLEGVPSAARYRTSNTPLHFDDKDDHPIAIDGLIKLSGTYESPYVTWSKAGGKNGTIIVSGASDPAIYTNNQLGAPNAWIRHEVQQVPGFARTLRVFNEDPNALLLMGAYNITPDAMNVVSLSVVSLLSLIKE